MPPLAFALPSLVAVLAAGSEAELFQLQEKNLRLKAELEQATGTLKVILDKVEAFDRRSCSGGTCSEPRKSPPRPVSPRSPRRRLTHSVGQTNCLPAATPSFGAVSGWETSRGANAFVAAGPGGSGSYYETTSEMSRTVDVTGGSYPSEVSWKLECGGVPAGNGRATDGTVHVISSSGLCTLTMEDSFGDGWNGAEWSIPSLGLGPFSMPGGSTAEVSFEVNPGFALGFDGAPCNGDGVATVAFKYHMFKDGALSLKSAEGATLWTKTGITASHTADVTGGSYPWEVSWELECGGVFAGNGGAFDGTAHVISFRPLLSSGNCTLTMEDSFGDGWNGAEWSVPSLGLGPFSMPSGSTAEVSFEVPPGDTGWDQSEAVPVDPVNSASFHFVYVPPESSPPLSTAAIAQMAVCCSPPAASSKTYVHHSVPHSFADAGACLHTEGPPLTIREDATSTVGDSNAALRLEPPRA